MISRNLVKSESEYIRRFNCSFSVLKIVRLIICFHLVFVGNTHSVTYLLMVRCFGT